MNKIDFALVITAEKCNPNGDPVNGNMPRQDYDGYGEISSVCIKRKIRNRLSEFGEEILMMSNDLMDEERLFSVKDRMDAVPEIKELIKEKNGAGFLQSACKHWYDVRAFGQVFPFKGLIGTATVSVRGPVSFGIATSLEPIIVTQMHITKSTNSEKNDAGKDRSTMGMRYIMDKGAYVSYGAISPQLAEKSGFNEEDAEKLKHAMIHLLDNDASSCRPAGSMDSTLFWAVHDTKCGNLSSAKVRELYGIKASEEYPYFTYDIKETEGIKIEVY